MTRTRLIIGLGAVTIVFLTIASFSKACNEAICASVVSKCMLTGSCKCDLVTCTCCKECFNCLSYLYDECCSCVDLCPKPNVTDNPLSKKSHVEEFSEPVPGLFLALTADPDPHKRWLTYTYPVDFNVTMFKSKQDHEPKYYMQSIDTESKHPQKPNTVTVNCTVAYMAQCSSWNKCKASCQSMGATSFRWFHDGCCECIGNTCINYGINESRCLHCPLDKEDDDLKDQYDDYGQEEELNEDELD